MSIASKRFEFLNQETNIGVSDFIKAGNTGILSSINNELKTVTGSLDSLIKDVIKKFPQIKTTKETIDATIDNFTRTSKDMLSTIRDLSQFSTKDIDGMIKDALPDGPAQAAFRRLSEQCRNRALSNGGLGKPFDPTLSCNGRENTANSNSCNSGEISDVLNKLTNGEYQSTYRDLNKLLRNFMSLANYGYDMNLCGVFNALSTGLGTDVLSRAAGGLIRGLGAANNTNALLDIAGASSALYVHLENPNAVTDLYSGYQTPRDLKENDFSDYTERLEGAAELFYPRWSMSDDTGALLSPVVYGKSEGLMDIYTSKIMDYVPSSSNLNSVRDNDDLFRHVSVLTDSFSLRF